MCEACVLQYVQLRLGWEAVTQMTTYLPLQMLQDYGHQVDPKRWKLYICGIFYLCDSFKTKI